MTAKSPILKGSNQSGLRDHNERMVLSMIQRQGPLPGVEIAKSAGISQQTASVILRKLEMEGIVSKGAPMRGKVGKPSIPMGLAADGAFSVGMKIGRRSAEIVLLDLLGQVRADRSITYRYPMPALILSFLQATLDAITAGLPEAAGRIAGIGVAMPGQIWSWAETIGAPPSELDAWRDTDFPAAIARFSDLPVFIDNDATAACRAENTYGKGREFRDFAYFFLGSFIGGGVVMNHTVYEGYHNNAGAFGSLPSMDGAGGLRQLIDTASIYLLEARLREAGTDPAILWNRPDDWSSLGAPLERWIETTAAHLAQAALTACAVIDFEAVLIDGGFPADVRRKLVEATRANLLQLDMRGLFAPRIEEGAIGRSARSIGAASAPVFARYFLNTLGGVSGNLG